MKSLQSFKDMLGTYKEKDIMRAYRVGCAFAGLLIVGATTYDIHRSIKSNDTPPSREQLDYLASQIDDSRRATQLLGSWKEGSEQDGKIRP